MRAIRFLGSIALWLGAFLGIVAGGVWVAGKAGIIQPMIVISGSMEPGIMTGDLLIDRPIPTESVEVGDVLSLPSELTGKLVTHRVVSITPGADGTWEIRMHGDANADPDLEPYVVGDEVLTPWIQIPGGGKVVSKLMEPAVALPILLSLVALLGVALLDEEPRRRIRRTIERVGRRSPELDALDRELAAVGVDVSGLEEMDDLDLALLGVGIDVRTLGSPPGNDDQPDGAAGRSGPERERQPDDLSTGSPDHVPDREPVLTG